MIDNLISWAVLVAVVIIVTLLLVNLSKIKYEIYLCKEKPYLNKWDEEWQNGIKKTN